jgi:hypothetical protein
MMDKAGNTAQSAKESCQEVQKSFLLSRQLHIIKRNKMLLKYQKRKKKQTNKLFYYLVAITSLIVNFLHIYGFLLQAGQQVKAKAQGAADVVKDAVGAKK